MKNLIRTLAVLALFATAISACGGVADEGEDLSNEPVASDLKYSASEPLSWVAMSQKAAAHYAAHTRLMNIDGSIFAGDQFVWQYTFAGDGAIWVTVQCDGQTTHVISHGIHEPLMGIQAIDLAKVKVTVAKLQKIGAKAGLTGRWTSASLGQPLTPSSHAHWSLEQGGKEIFVDAFTGTLQQ